MDTKNGFRDQYSFLSNFYYFSFEYKNFIFLTSEHAFQWEKATAIEDKLKILKAKTPADAKKYGRYIKDLNIKEWDEKKVQIMEDILVAKFNNNILKKKLLDTNTTELIEYNKWHDNFWGKCICNKCKNKLSNEVNVHNNNILGKLLMKIRNN
jgi:hypothetical protein